MTDTPSQHVHSPEESVFKKQLLKREKGLLGDFPWKLAFRSGLRLNLDEVKQCIRSGVRDVHQAVLFLDPSYFDEEIIDFLVENSYLTNNLPEASYTLYKRILQSGVEVEDFILRVKNLTSEEADEVIADTQISHDDKRIIARQKFPHDLDFAEEISPRKREDMSDEEFELWIYRSKEFTCGDDTFSILTGEDLNYAQKEAFISRMSSAESLPLGVEDLEIPLDLFFRLEAQVTGGIQWRQEVEDRVRELDTGERSAHLRSEWNQNRSKVRWITQHLTPLDGDQILPFLRDTSLSKEARRDVAEKVSFTYDEGIIEKLDNVDSSERKRNAQRVNQWQKSEILSEHSDFKWNEEEVPEKRDVVFYWRHDQGAFEAHMKPQIMAIKQAIESGKTHVYTSVRVVCRYPREIPIIQKILPGIQVECYSGDSFVSHSTVFGDPMSLIHGQVERTKGCIPICGSAQRDGSCPRDIEATYLNLLYLGSQYGDHRDSNMSLLRFDGDGHKSLFRYLYAKHFDEDHPEYGLGSPLHYSIDEVCQMTLDAVLENDRKLLEKTKDVPVVTSTVSGNAQELLVETESHDS